MGVAWEREGRAPPQAATPKVGAVASAAEVRVAGGVMVCVVSWTGRVNEEGGGLRPGETAVVFCV